MENLVFTQLSVPEVRRLFRDELENYFIVQKQQYAKQPHPQEMLSIKQVANLLGVTTNTIYALVKKGYIPVRKVDGHLSFCRQEILEWLAGENYKEPRQK